MLEGHEFHELLGHEFHSGFIWRAGFLTSFLPAHVLDKGFDGSGVSDAVFSVDVLS